jgi:arylsulfatase A-like enzyme
MLQKAGYRTAAIGKWHLGLGDKTKPIDWNGEITPGPCEVGFDYSFIMAATGDRAPCVYVKNHRVVGLVADDPISVSYKEAYPGEPTGIDHRENLKMDWTEGHNQSVVNGIGRIGYMKGGKAALWKDEDMADVFTKEALEFIEREQSHSFFLYFATHDIHVPRIPHPRFVGKTNMGARGDAIAEFDESVGRILKKLDELNLAKNTLVILSSDNGPVLDDGYKDGANEKLGDHKPAGPLRGGKYCPFEGGTRIPFVTRWPEHIQPGVSDAVVSQVDFLASFAALAGQAPDVSTAPDTTNMLPAFLGQTHTGRDQVLEHANKLSLRSGSWKYIPPGNYRDQLNRWNRVSVPEPGLLYDLNTDLGETTNLSAQHPEVVQELRNRMATLAGGNLPAGSKEKR